MQRLDLCVVRRNGSTHRNPADSSVNRASRGRRRLRLLTVPDTQMSDMIASNSDLPEVAGALASNWRVAATGTCWS